MLKTFAKVKEGCPSWQVLNESLSLKSGIRFCAEVKSKLRAQRAEAMARWGTRDLHPSRATTGWSSTEEAEA